MTGAIEFAEPVQQGDQGSDQYLTFMLSNEEYGVDILKVQEIKGWDGVTPMPNMPNHIMGVINLRGTVVPVISLRELFGLEPTEIDKTTVVIVVRVSDEEQDGDRTMGIVVDAVSEVHNIASSDVRPAPDFSGACGANAIKGLAMHDKTTLILLDIDPLMTDCVPRHLQEADAV